MHTEKVGGAKFERDSFSDVGMKHGTLNRIFKFHENVQCGIIICYDFIDNILRSRIIDACNVIIVPQTNEVPKRLLDLARGEINNPSGPGIKAFVMVSGLFTFPGMDGINGGDSGIISTLDKGTFKKKPDSIIMSEYVENESVREQLKKILGNSQSLIQSFSPIWHREIWGNKDESKNLRNLDINRIKDKCRLIVV
ncbi:MAG: hypothetical protein U9P81_02155 [Euryarchaeota archaeon]|nr:hypothetical protein [Euryarchaeota archaeon]